MDELKALRALATELGVHTRYTDGLGKKITVAPETLVRVCAALGAPITRVSEAAQVLSTHRAAKAAEHLPPVVVAWDGIVPPHSIENSEVQLESGHVAPPGTRQLPLGYHRVESCTVIAAPVEAWRRSGSHRSWGVGTHLAALRSGRSRSLADLRDLESLCRWVREKGGDLVTVLPLLPTFNANPPDPSPYSPVSRLFWSELILDLEGAHRPTGAVKTLDVTRADGEVRAALAQHPVPEEALRDGELVRYAHFRGAQKRLGRNWRDWPAPARAGKLGVEHLDAEEERYHLVAQTLARRQLRDLRERLDRAGLRLGLDLAVGVHPDGYDP
ncbi:MAG TPA: 4-alpha-glucanotransferase, partial [Gemmatimonadales bacterium]|nr:4-alpha-glucanotransferase [Gemmatimonadales bacterium]